MSILWVGSAIAVAAAIGGAYWAGHTAGSDAQASRAQRDQDLVAQAGDAAASAAAAQIARIQVRHTTIRGEVEREIQTRVEYRDCVHSPGQLQRINAALANAAPASAPLGDSGLP